MCFVFLNCIESRLVCVFILCLCSYVALDRGLDVLSLSLFCVSNALDQGLVGLSVFLLCVPKLHWT